MSERDLNNTVTPNPKLAVDYCGIKMKILLSLHLAPLVMALSMLGI